MSLTVELLPHEVLLLNFALKDHRTQLVEQMGEGRPTIGLLDALWHKLNPQSEMVTVHCTSPACRGRQNGGDGFRVTVRKGEESRAECNECFCR